ncbi:MAG: PilZ domain-containing protein [Candidatus Aureabacteria bacterium]|nr:PilZ domain-containing protein [Candidatus Auribacterota bacterium]
MKPPYPEERRQSERTQCILETGYRLPGRETSIGETRDVSDGGVLLMVSGEVKKDDLLDLEIPLGTGAEPLRTRGRVVHTRPVTNTADGGTLAGMVFLTLSEQQQEALGKKIWHQILKESTRFGRE